MSLEFGNRRVEDVEISAHSSLKDGALHRTQHEAGEGNVVDTARQLVSSPVEVAAHTLDPDAEEPVDAPANCGVAFRELGGKGAKWGAEHEVVCHQVPSGSFDDRENTFERVAVELTCRAEDLRFEELTHMIDHRQQKILLGRKEMVETPAGRLCLLHDFVDTRLGVTLAPEEAGGGGYEPFSSVRSTRQSTISTEWAQIN